MNLLHDFADLSTADILRNALNTKVTARRNTFGRVPKMLVVVVGVLLARNVYAMHETKIG